MQLLPTPESPSNTNLARKSFESVAEEVSLLTVFSPPVLLAGTEEEQPISHAARRRRRGYRARGRGRRPAGRGEDRALACFRVGPPQFVRSRRRRWARDQMVGVM